jgi:hypothetical protein
LSASYHVNFLADPFRLFKAGFGFNLLGRVSRLAGHSDRTVSGVALVRGNEAS